MAGPLRIEFLGALYHITSRGDGREDIYLDDAGREMFFLFWKRFEDQCAGPHAPVESEGSVWVYWEFSMEYKNRKSWQ